MALTDDDLDHLYDDEPPDDEDTCPECGELVEDCTCDPDDGSDDEV